MEVPLSFVVPRVMGVVASAALLWYVAPMVLWTKKPASLDPEFLAEAKRIGNVAQRMHAPPVYLNPFTNRMSGGILGPEDLKDKA
ncbi:hypothetical protein FOA52_007114 [Chlamydomonas sp. UWO 241]|nr:hypothetical protein FOA52_007114 [Chlamydomonas sp. UWO 241]